MECPLGVGLLAGSSMTTSSSEFCQVNVYRRLFKGIVKLGW